MPGTRSILQATQGQGDNQSGVLADADWGGMVCVRPSQRPCSRMAGRRRISKRVADTLDQEKGSPQRDLEGQPWESRA